MNTLTERRDIPKDMKDALEKYVAARMNPATTKTQLRIAYANLRIEIVESDSERRFTNFITEVSKRTSSQQERLAKLLTTLHVEGDPDDRGDMEYLTHREIVKRIAACKTDADVMQSLAQAELKGGGK